MALEDPDKGSNHCQTDGQIQLRFGDKTLLAEKKMNLCLSADMSRNFGQLDEMKSYRKFTAEDIFFVSKLFVDKGNSFCVIKYFRLSISC